MATYSNEPTVEIVSYTGSVDNPGDNYQSTSLDLVTVESNTTYEIISCFGSADSGGARFICFGKTPDGYLSGISGLTHTGEDHADLYVYFMNKYYNTSEESYKVFHSGANATQDWSDFYQLKPSDAEYGYTYYPGTTIVMTIDTYKHNSAGEQAAAKFIFKKTTYPT